MTGPFLRLLFAAADLAVVLVFGTQRLRAAEAPQAVGDWGVLFHVDRQIQEVFILTAHLGYTVRELHMHNSTVKPYNL